MCLTQEKLAGMDLEFSYTDLMLKISLCLLCAIPLKGGLLSLNTFPYVFKSYQEKKGTVSFYISNYDQSLLCSYDRHGVKTCTSRYPDASSLLF